MPQRPSRTPKPTKSTKAYMPPIQTDGISELDLANKQIERILESQDDYVNEIDDLRGILLREYKYHTLRAEELKRELYLQNIQA